MERVTTIAARLKEYRVTNNLTLADMEKKVKIPAQTLNRYELGQRAPKIDVAVQVAEHLGVNPLWLQGYDVPEIDDAQKSSALHGEHQKMAKRSISRLEDADLTQDEDSQIDDLITWALKNMRGKNQ